MRSEVLRIEATSKHTTKALDLRSGGRRVGEWMHLYLVQVRLAVVHSKSSVS